MLNEKLQNDSRVRVLVRMCMREIRRIGLIVHIAGYNIFVTNLIKHLDTVLSFSE